MNKLYSSIYRKVNHISRNKILVDPELNLLKIQEFYISLSKIFREVMEHDPESVKNISLYQKLDGHPYFNNPKPLDISFLEYVYFKLLERKYNPPSSMDSIPENSTATG
jgi:hypothetical protein